MSIRYNKRLNNTKLKIEIKRLKGVIAEKNKEITSENNKRIVIFKKNYAVKMGVYKANLRKKAKARYRKLEVKKNKGLRTQALDLAEKKLDRLKLNHTNYIDGVLAFPVMLNYAYDNNLGKQEIAYFILANVLGGIMPVQCIKYGFPKYAISLKTLATLHEKWLLEKFSSGKNVIYSPSIKGKGLFRQFKIYYRAKMKDLISSDGYTRHGHTWNEWDKRIGKSN